MPSKKRNLHSDGEKIIAVVLWCLILAHFWLQVTQERAQSLGSAHEVQRYHRDADETKDWMEEKDHSLDMPDIGHDLATVQRLQRKHEGMERDLVALGEKVDHIYN